MAANLEAQVRHENNTAVIDLKGDIDGAGEDALQQEYAEGIALIVMLLAQARKTGTPLWTTGLSPHYIEIFNITRLSDFMKFYPDEQAALANSK